MRHNSGIYEIVNKSNGHAYGGSSVNVAKRWGEHVRVLRHGAHKNRYLQNAWNKYGEESFEFRLLAPLGLDKQMVELVEQEYLNEWFGNRWCYNLHPLATGGDSPAASQWRKDHPKEVRQIVINRSKAGGKARAKWAKNNPEIAYQNSIRGGKGVAQWHKDHPKQSHRNAIRAGSATMAEKLSCGKSKNAVWAAHVRWHNRRNIINPDCLFCIQLPLAELRGE